MNLSPAQLGFVRSLGVIALMSLLTYLGDAAHFNGVLSFTTATIVSGLAMSLEHYIESKGGPAMFGAVRHETVASTTI